MGRNDPVAGVWRPRIGETGAVEGLDPAISSVADVEHALATVGHASRLLELPCETTPLPDPDLQLLVRVVRVESEAIRDSPHCPVLRGRLKWKLKKRHVIRPLSDALKEV